MPTPHSGYHWHRTPTRFFEGWYLRVTLPNHRQSFAFMYSIDDPTGNQPHSDGFAQILGADDEYLCRSFPIIKSYSNNNETSWRVALYPPAPFSPCSPTPRPPVR